ncbi:Receptor-interacting serine/threonine-protein kinase 1 [Mortierella sp. NVP85]|nr:Receptor-interacting serine/threonine-protein kinase 1 [Mortierella sp. NVP85]
MLESRPDPSKKPKPAKPDGGDQGKKKNMDFPNPHNPKPIVEIPEHKAETVLSSVSFKRPYDKDSLTSSSASSSQETPSHALLEETLQQEQTGLLTNSPKAKRHRSQSKSKSNSPAPMLARFPTPTSLGGWVAGDADETSRNAQIVLPTRPTTMTIEPLAAPEASRQSRPPSPRPAVTLPPHIAFDKEVIDIPSPMPDDPDMITQGEDDVSISTMSSASSSLSDGSDCVVSPLELVRSGTFVLNLLLSNSTSKHFVNMVPLSAINYHRRIKHPMDLGTIEQKLWKGYDINKPATGELSTQALVAATGHLRVTEGYSVLQEFEQDLKLIYDNAVYFNPPDDIIYKEAQMFRTLCSGVMRACLERQPFLDYMVPQELYTPSLISFSEPGPLYLFRAHLVKEMDRKMTDISVDLFATLHQPLFETMNGTNTLSPESPQFVRIYINKNRSLLERCRDEVNAKLAIITDLHTSKPFVESSVIQTEGGVKANISTRMVHVTARVMIVKPIGERHEMVTVGDLDCPSAWIMVVCVKRLNLQVNVPAKFEKGVLNKMRHEVVPYGPNTKVSIEHQRLFLNALGVMLPDFPDPAPTSSVVESTTSLATASSVPPTLSSGPMNKSASTITPTPMSTSLHGMDSTSTIPPRTPPSIIPIIDIDPEIEEDPPLKKPKIEVIDDIFPLSEPLPVPDDESTFDLHQVKEEEQVPFLADSSTGLSLATSETTPFSSLSSLEEHPQASSSSASSLPITTPDRMEVDRRYMQPTWIGNESSQMRILSSREQEMLRDLKLSAEEKGVPYINWDTIVPTLTMDSAQGLFKRIYHVQGDSSLVIQNFKEMDKESFEQRVREVACLLKLRGLEGVGQIQSVIDDGKDRLVGLSMTKYAHTLKAYATNARRHPSPCQKISLIRDMVMALSDIHESGLAHRDLSEVNIMIDEDFTNKLEDNTPRPLVRVIDFGKSVFVKPEEVQRWSIRETVPKEELELLPMVVLVPDHGYKLYRSIMTLPRTKYDTAPLPPVDPLAEDVYSLGVLIWRTFSGKSPWNGAIEDDLKTIRYLVKSDDQIKFQLEREITGKKSRELLLKCLTANPDNRWTARQLKEWLNRPEICSELLKEFEALGGGRKRTRKVLD